MRRIKLKIEGIHCKSCKEIIESEVGLLSGVKNIAVNAKNSTAEVEFDSEKATQEEIVKEIEALNYGARIIKVEDKEEKSSTGNLNKNGISLKKFLIGGVLLLIIGTMYYAASLSGAFELLGRLDEPNLSYPLIFIIGLLASFHCIGMCGGIVIAYTSRFCVSVKGNKNINLPHINYNLGRILSYTITGFLLGGIGSFFAINKIFAGTITLLAGLFMIAVGLSLLIRVPFLDKITGILPVSFVRLFSSQLHAAKPRTPFIIGFLNGFMPCGPLQALQIYALTSGSALRGGISMAAFGLGTAPLMLGFGNIISLFTQSRLKQIMKVSGVIVIILGFLTLSRGVNGFPFSKTEGNDGHDANVSDTSRKTQSAPNNSPVQNESYQTVKMSLTNQGYSPNTLTVKKGIPVRWVINVQEISGCTSEILLPAYNIARQLKSGENIIEFTPKVAGTYKFSCGMRMVWGKFVVTE